MRPLFLFSALLLASLAGHWNVAALPSDDSRASAAAAAADAAAPPRLALLLVIGGDDDGSLAQAQERALLAVLPEWLAVPHLW